MARRFATARIYLRTFPKARAYGPYLLMVLLPGLAGTPLASSAVRVPRAPLVPHRKRYQASLASSSRLMRASCDLMRCE